MNLKAAQENLRRFRERNRQLQDKLDGWGHELGIQTSDLLNLMRYSHGIQEDLSDDLIKTFGAVDRLTVATCGSFARAEASQDSDADFIIVFDQEAYTADHSAIKEIMRFVANWFAARGIHVTGIEEIRADSFLRRIDDLQRGKFPCAFPAQFVLGTVGHYEYDYSDARTRRIVLLTEANCLYGTEYFHEIVSQLQEEEGLTTCIAEHQTPRVFLDDVSAHYAGFYPGLWTRLRDVKSEDPADVPLFKLLCHRRISHMTLLASILFHITRREPATDELLERCVQGPPISRCLYLFEIADEVIRTGSLVRVPPRMIAANIIRYYNLAMSVFARYRAPLEGGAVRGAAAGSLHVAEVRHDLHRYLGELDRQLYRLLGTLHDALVNAGDDRGVLAFLV